MAPLPGEVLPSSSVDGARFKLLPHERHWAFLVPHASLFPRLSLGETARNLPPFHE